MVIVVRSTGLQPLRRRAQDRLDHVETGFAQPVIGIDQDDRIVHHDARKRDDARAGHDHREGLSGDHHADHHADRRHDHGRQGDERVEEAVELGEQDDEHQEQGREHGLGQELRRLLLLLVRSSEHELKPFGPALLLEPGIELLHLVVGEDAVHRIGLDEDRTLTVLADDRVDRLLRRPGGEVGNRHEAARRLQPQLVEARDRTLVLRQPNPDVDLSSRLSSGR